jgi:CRP/FNR family transcriptional regulator, polysaccharide utilization system transcription regulator
MGLYSRIEKNNEGIVELPFFSFLTDEEKDLIRSNSNIVHYNRRENIFLQNTRTSHIMYLNTGLVKIYKEGKGDKSLILKLATTHQFLGLMSIFGSDIHDHSAATIEPSDVYYIDISIFNKIVKENGHFAYYLIHLLSIDGIYLFNKLVGQAHKQLPGRIADVLLYFSEQIFKAEKFTLPLTRRELAELAGTTKESFIRTLTEFKNDKIIQLDGSDVEITSMKIVKTLSELG